MKRRISVTLSAALCLLLASCSSSSDSGGGKKKDATSKEPNRTAVEVGVWQIGDIDAEDTAYFQFTPEFTEVTQEWIYTEAVYGESFELAIKNSAGDPVSGGSCGGGGAGGNLAICKSSGGEPKLSAGKDYGFDLVNTSDGIVSYTFLVFRGRFDIVDGSTSDPVELDIGAEHASYATAPFWGGLANSYQFTTTDAGDYTINYETLGDLVFTLYSDDAFTTSVASCDTGTAVEDLSPAAPFTPDPCVLSALAADTTYYLSIEAGITQRAFTAYVLTVDAP